MDNTACTCGNFGCSVREKRGLTPFCKMAPEPPSDRGMSYPEASAAVRQDGGRIEYVSGGYGTGSPARFRVKQGV